MDRFKEGDRVIIPDGSTWGYGNTRVDEFGPGAILDPTPDWDGDLYVELDSGEFVYCQESQLRPENDPINPRHYKKGLVEVIDLIETFGYLEGNIVKYVSRYSEKNGLEDLRKAEWYLQRLIKRVESEEA